MDILERTDPLWSLLKAALGFALAVMLVHTGSFLSKVWHYRSLMRRLDKAGKPMPKHNAFLGHMLAAKDLTDKLPPMAGSIYILNGLSKQLGDTGAFYFDSYPIAVPLLVITDPFIANQVIAHPWTGSEKPYTLDAWFAPISGRGGLNLFTENGLEWRRSHEMFLPFFNNSNLDGTLPVVMQEMLIFRDILRRKATSPETLRLEPIVLHLMNDVIGHVVFNAKLNNQTSGSHPLSNLMLLQLELKFAINNVIDNIGQLNPFRKLAIWDNGRKLDTHIKAQIEARVEIFRSAKIHDEHEPFNSLLDQALAHYYAQPGRRQFEPLDAESMKVLISQLRMFFFAGNDSTAATMISLCYFIWKHPSVLANLRAEHDEVFGRNIAACPDLIVENPSILNSLPYTNACIKEAMRLFPPANGIREGCKDLVLRGRDGTEYPTEDVLVQMNHISIQRNPKAWVRPDEYLPERFLVGPEDELSPPKGAWRPFEYGTRNCTGQAFVVKELKVFLAIVAREFDFEERYNEIYAGEKVDLSSVFGEKAFLVEAGSSHPRGQFPCRIRMSGYMGKEER
ncbi:cytochrome P450 71B25 [Xylariaceae sp. FL0016]|nr:cytochrome P450 71B25 [Xylariaceae sp. FL0016]